MQDHLVTLDLLDINTTGFQNSDIQFNSIIADLIFGSLGMVLGLLSLQQSRYILVAYWKALNGC